VVQDEVYLEGAVLLGIVVQRISLLHQCRRHGILHHDPIVGERIRYDYRSRVSIIHKSHQQSCVAQVDFEHRLFQIVG